MHSCFFGFLFCFFNLGYQPVTHLARNTRVITLIPPPPETCRSDEVLAPAMLVRGGESLVEPACFGKGSGLMRHEYVHALYIHTYIIHRYIYSIYVSMYIHTCIYIYVCIRPPSISKPSGEDSVWQRELREAGAQWQEQLRVPRRQLRGRRGRGGRWI